MKAARTARPYVRLCRVHFMPDFTRFVQHVTADAPAILAGRVRAARCEWSFGRCDPRRASLRYLARASNHARPVRGRRSAAALRNAAGEPPWPARRHLGQHAARQARPPKPWLLAPIDLQAIKAAGVTFAVSMLERVIEERARGNPAAAAAIRAEVQRLVGNDLANLKPGSPEAMALKKVLIEQGAWSQYLEVGIGPDAEIFTKTTVMASVGTGMDAGLHPKSTWNNPEPEVVLVISRPAASSAPRSATTSICAMSRAARRSCSARPRTTTPPARSGRSCASSTRHSRSTTSTHDRDAWWSRARTATASKARPRSPRSAATRKTLSPQMHRPHHQYPGRRGMPRRRLPPPRRRFRPSRARRRRSATKR